MVKVAIDAGHGGSDPGAVFEGRKEKDDNLKLAMAVGEILKNNGIDVFYTRTQDVYQKPLEKAMLANESGADYLVSFHRNSGAIPNQYTGVQTLVYSDEGVKGRMARAVNSELENLGFRNIGVSERPGLVLLRRSKMPAILIETGFINSEEDNMLFDDEFDRIAQGIAKGIMDTIKEEQGVSAENEVTYYRVQTGLYRKLENAQRQLDQLLKEGYPAFMVQKDGYYSVQVGAFENLSNAVKMEAILRQNGYQTYITT
ncbi:MAG: N-acetylmuramoyl-L-alanine amidase [Muricoprocola sp.]